VIKRTGLRQEAFVGLMQLAGVFGPGQTRAELETSLADAGLVKVRCLATEHWPTCRLVDVVEAEAEGAASKRIPRTGW
jgi:hypothetical protein